MLTWSPPTVPFIVGARADNGAVTEHTFRAVPRISLREFGDLVQSGIDTLALDDLLHRFLCADDGDPSSRRRWELLVDDEDVTLAPGVGGDVVEHLIEQTCYGRNFVEICTVTHLLFGVDDHGSYFRGRLLSAGLDDRAPLSAAIDVWQAVAADNAGEGLAKWRQDFDQAMRSSRVRSVPTDTGVNASPIPLPPAGTAAAVGADPTPKRQSGGFVSRWAHINPDRATWGLLPEHQAQSARLQRAARGDG